jgi:hypothetical protein
MGAANNQFGRTQTGHPAAASFSEFFLIPWIVPLVL